MIKSLWRRHAAALVAGVLATAVVSGCSSDSSNNSSAEPAGEPVTIDTAYGEITVDEKPQRILALDPGYVELLSLLDEKPFAFASYLSDNAELLEYSPWMEGQYEGEPDPSLFTADYQPAVEVIATMEPDLILTTIWQTDEQLYKQLSEIAPTFVGTEADTNTEWQDSLAALATLTRNDEAVVEEVEAEYDTALEAAAQKLPGLQDKTFQVAASGPDEQLWLTEYAAAPLIAMGLKPGENQPLTGEEGANALRLSQETVDQLTADVVLIATEHRDPTGEFKADLQADPRVAALPAAQNGTLIFLTAQQWNAVNGGTPASLRWWLDQVLPQLEAAPLNAS